MELSMANRERLERVLAHLNPHTGAAEIRHDGYLWIRSRPTTTWHRMVRIRGRELRAATAWVAAYMQGTHG